MLVDHEILHLVNTPDLYTRTHLIRGWDNLSQALQPASFDLRLGAVSDPDGAPLWPQQSFDDASRARGWMLPPGGCYLGSTIERLTLPPTISARVEGKSSVGRAFVIVHCTAGFIDPGFDGEITLEIVNLSPRPVWFSAGQYVAQACFFRCATPTRLYGEPRLKSHYQGQTGPTPAAIKAL